MTASARPDLEPGDPFFGLDDSFSRELPELRVEWQASDVPRPALVVLNDDLAVELGLASSELRSDAGVEVLAGNRVPPGPKPVALGYAGHQFGHYSPQLGDGRALLLGELVDPRGSRWDLHLKGSGRTPFARGGDGKATIGPMLREYIVAEALDALGVPTTRALAVVTTGEDVARDGLEPGAVLTRVAASHIRVGTFEYAARLGGPELVGRLADHALRRHHRRAADAGEPLRDLLARVIDAQASLVARWMLLGFIHGVMNTDNTTISGEGIDYGPCAFMDRFDPATVFSSIDHSGRYAYGNQPLVAQWNLARFAETLVPLLAEDPDDAVRVANEEIDGFPTRFRRHWGDGMAAKLGLVAEPGDDELFEDLLAAMQADDLDLTNTFRQLAGWLRGGDELPAGADELAAWTRRWKAALDRQGRDPAVAAGEMDRVNPAYVPRNHLVEEALGAATAGELEPFRRLLAVVVDPFTTRPGLERYTEPAPVEFTATFRTFCGT